LNKNWFNLNAIFLGLLLLVLLPQVMASTAQQADYLYPAQITDYRFLPEIITAGDTVSMAVDIQNIGALVAMTDVNSTLDIGDYFEPVQITSNVNSIAAGSTKTTVLKFKVKDSTPSGYYQIFLNLSFNRTDYTGNVIDVNQTKVLTVPVSASQKNVEIKVNPSVISPGNQTPLTVSILNNSSTPLSNVSFSWTESTGAILPLGSDNKRFASYIGAGEKFDFNYLVVADPSIVTGIYPLSVSLSYNDSNGQKTQTSQVGIVVGGKTDFQISSDTLSSGQVSFSIANIGSNNASAVVVKMPAQTGLTITGSDTVIIGTINKGDYSVANFTVQSTDQNANSQRNNTRTGTQTNLPGQQSPGISRDFNSPDMNSNPAFNQRQNQGGFIIDIYYTDTTGERQIIHYPFQLGTAKATVTGMASGNGFSSGRQQGTDNLLLIGVFAVILIIGVIFNKFVAKKDWKKLGIVALIGIIIPAIIIFFAPSSLSSVIFAAVFFIGILAVFFKIWKRGKE